MPDAPILQMPATRSEREKHRRAGELMIADKARWLVTARAIEQWNKPGTPLEQALDKFFVCVALAGGGAAIYFLWHQVTIWAQ